MHLSEIFCTPNKWNRSYLTGVLVLLCSLVLPVHARADDVATIAVPKPSGPKAGPIQKNLQHVLEAHDYNVVRSEDAGVAATITATTRKAKKRWRLDIVLTGPNGDTLGETSFKARKPGALARMAKKLLWKRLGNEIEQAALASTAETVEEEQEEADEPAEEEESPDDVVPPPQNEGTVGSASKDTPGPKATVSVGPQVFRRSFDYAGDAMGLLAIYDVPAVLALAFAADYFPLPNIGASASFSYAPSFDTTIDGATTESFPTTMSAFMVGARARYPVSRFLTMIDLDYGGHSFIIKDGAVPRPQIPNVKYRFIRLGVAGTTEIKPGIVGGLYLGYRHLLAFGEIEDQDWFPRLGGSALDAELSVAIDVFSSWQVEVGARIERYSLNLKTQDGDARIASSATDQYLSGTIALKYQYAK